MRNPDGSYAPKLVFISWAPYCSRSDNLARRLGGQSFLVYTRTFGSRWLTVLLKYLWLALKTAAILRRERPEAVFLMAPPILAAVPVHLYALLTGARFVIDSHTGAFLDDRWRRTIFLHRFYSRRAAATLVTNEHLAGVVRSWGARAVVVPDVPVEFAGGEGFPLPAGLNVVLVNSFALDEPLEEFLRAAARLPSVNFWVTGDRRSARRAYWEGAPANVVFTGYLADDRYGALLAGCDGVMVLTTRDHTMQRGGYEAVYQGKPVLTTGWGILRRFFHQGAVFTDNSVEDLVRAVRVLERDIVRLRDEARALRAERLREWEDRRRSLLGLLAAPCGAHTGEEPA